MISTKKLFLILTFCVLLPVVLHSQSNELLVPDMFSGGTTLNAAIAADANRPADRVYVLKRGGYYMCDAPIANTGWTLRIKGEEGPGPRPVIWMTKTTGSANPNFINHSGSVWLKDFVWVGYVEPDAITDIPGGVIQTNANGFDVEIDGCVFTQNRGQFLRTNSYCRVIKFTNSIFANAGQLPNSNLGAGKIVDLRNVSCDSLIMQNNTIVNFQDRIVRHYSSTAALNYFKFDQNTVINGMSYHGTLILGWVGDKVEITNNLWIDPFALGNDTDKTRQAEFNESGEFDQYGFARMNWISTVPREGVATQFAIRNNYYSISDSGQAFFNRHAAAGVTGEGSPLTHYINKALGADSVNAFIKEKIVLGNTPKLMTKFMDWYRSSSGGNKTKGVTNFTRAYDFDRRNYEYFVDTLDARYPTTVAAYTGADKGLPVGDLNWFPDKKVIWSSVERIDDAIATNYTLEQNYPNPFNPSTNIVYSLPKASVVTITIYNSIGQEITKLINGQEQIAGKYNVSWNGKDAAGRNLASGIYFYQLKTNEQNMTKKMLLLK